MEHGRENAKKKNICLDRLNGHTEHLHCFFALNADMSYYPFQGKQYVMTLNPTRDFGKVFVSYLYPRGEVPQSFGRAVFFTSLY